MADTAADEAVAVGETLGNPFIVAEALRKGSPTPKSASASSSPEAR
jgi:hypothetical protein